MSEEELSLTHVDCLPAEVLEYILGLVSPYGDLEACKLTCKRWRDIVQEVVRKQKMRFCSSLTSGDVLWETIPSTQDLFTTISRRYSHSACLYDNHMYVFGGCTSTNTTFNDLWKLNLSTRSWVRPLPTGCYPSPKACSTLVRYKDSLVLYGGWAQSSASPLHQVCQLFNEINIYRLKTNRWDFEYTHPAPPSSAGHSATVHGHKMIVFGGIRRQISLGQPSQDVIVYDIESNSWSFPELEAPKPAGRYGQTQIVLDEHHLLIIGGCGGPNSIFNDVWLLSMKGTKWSWTEISVENAEHSASHMWCSPGCKVNDQVVFLCRRPNDNSTPSSSSSSVAAANNNQPAPPPPAYASHYNMSAQIRGRSVWVPPVENNLRPGREEEASNSNRKSGREAEKEKNVNGHRGDFDHRQRGGAEAGPARPIGNNGALPRPSGSRPSVRPNAMKNREKQLEAFKLMEERIQRLQGKAKEKADAAEKATQAQYAVSLCVLDISRALSERKVRWLPAESIANDGSGLDRRRRSSPEEAVLYSIVHGRGELVVFGGVQRFVATQAETNVPGNGGPNIVSNAVYFIRAPQPMI